MTQSYENGTLLGWCVQLVTRVVGHMLENAEISGIANLLAPQMLYIEAEAQFFVFSKRLQGFSSLNHLSTVRSLCSPITKRTGANERAYSPSDLMNKALCFDTYYLFE